MTLAQDNLAPSSDNTCFIIHPVFKNREGYASVRETEEILEEIEGLARSIRLSVLKTEVISISRIKSSSFLGSGQQKAIKESADIEKPDVIIVNHSLTPVQQRNLEKSWNAKVIDRTGLILEIFGERAQTREGRLQVELAYLNYQRSRLVRSWTHLERQRGGTGFVGGPGETQIEIDRRLIDTRITGLKKRLQKVRKTRDLARDNRERNDIPVVALVGYTNAGKSTLFNRLTSENIYAEDLPFATLDPTMRQFDLSGGKKAVLSDTVGFIANLPTHLVESFKATLEQIVDAQLIVHVINTARNDIEAQRQDVIEILDQLGVDYENDERIIEVYNKIDALETQDRQEYERQASLKDNLCAVSAYTGDGIDSLVETITGKIFEASKKLSYIIPAKDGKALAWLHQNTHVVDTRVSEDNVRITVHISDIAQEKFQSRNHYDPIETN